MKKILITFLFLLCVSSSWADSLSIIGGSGGVQTGIVDADADTSVRVDTDPATDSDIITFESKSVEMCTMANDGTYKQLIVGADGAQNYATKPSLAFGDGDSGVYEAADDALNWAIAGANELRLDATNLRPLVNGGLDLGSNGSRWNNIYSGGITYSNNFQPAFTAAGIPVCASTADGSDNVWAGLCGGGSPQQTRCANTRGGFVHVNGNEEATYLGSVEIATGDIVTADITLTANDDISIAGDFITTESVYRAVTTVNAATYDLLTTDHILHVTYTGTAAVTSLTLPTAQCDDATDYGRIVIIKDAGGNATSNNITIDTEGAETIDGAATYVIDTDYNSISIYCENDNWFIF